MSDTTDTTDTTTHYGEFATLTVEDDVATLRIDRPDRNRINAEVGLGLVDALVELTARRPDVRAAVITGGDEYFSGGGDLAEMGPQGYADMIHNGGNVQLAAKLLENLPYPVVAAVEGFAQGGGLELAMACDFRIVAQGATLSVPEIQIGIMQGAGGSQRLPRLVGVAKAKEIIFTGRNVSTEEALQIGLVTEVVEPGTTYRAALEMAKKFATGPTIALRAAKTAINQGMNMSLDQALAFESQLFASLYSTQDQKAGMKAYFETGIGTADFQGR